MVAITISFRIRHPLIAISQSSNICLLLIILSIDFIFFSECITTIAPWNRVIYYNELFEFNEGFVSGAKLNDCGRKSQSFFTRWKNNPDTDLNKDEFTVATYNNENIYRVQLHPRLPLGEVVMDNYAPLNNNKIFDRPCLI